MVRTPTLSIAAVDKRSGSLDALRIHCGPDRPGGVNPAPTRAWGWDGRKSSITFVTELGRAKSYRFFLGVGPDSGYELAPDPTGDSNQLPARGIDCGKPADVGGECLGGWGGVIGASGWSLLLPLCGFESAWRVREDVRDAEVCVALVGDFLRAAEAQGF